MFILALLLCLYTNPGEAMTLENINGDMPPNVTKILPIEYIKITELASEQKFDEASIYAEKYFSNLNKENKGKEKEFYLEFERFYKKSEKEYAEDQQFLHESIAKKDFIYNQFIRYFWWEYYYYTYIQSFL